MSITTLQLNILMAAYTGSRDMDTFDKSTEIYQRQCKTLIDEGMIEANLCNSRGDYWGLTAKGKFWYKYILAVPFPVEFKSYTIPGMRDLNK